MPKKRNWEALPAVRAQTEEAIEKLRTACVVARRNGFDDIADDFMRNVRSMQVLTQVPGGYLWYLEEDRRKKAEELLK